jgi:hypothetical protein
VVITEFKDCCISDEMDGREDEEEVGNVDIEHKSVSIECEITENRNCEDTEAETGDKNGEQNETDETE